MKWVPGTHWDYSNIGYALLGHLAGRIAGKDLRVFTREHLFEPLGLEHIAWTLADTPARLRATPYDLTNGVLVPVEPVGFPDWPAGMIRASVGDLTRLVSTVANGGAAQATRLLSATGVSEMLMAGRPRPCLAAIAARRHASHQPLGRRSERVHDGLPRSGLTHGRRCSRQYLGHAAEPRRAHGHRRAGARLWASLGPLFEAPDRKSTFRSRPMQAVSTAPVDPFLSRFPVKLDFICSYIIYCSIWKTSP